ncbi:hypothetical protein [Streptomyces sp. NPDC006856]|uniref:hypothetical protein n=1 Tax=Streptomyces sp. NPDC006856 TaxID=3364766 RepID=UPI0036B109A4
MAHLPLEAYGSKSAPREESTRIRCSHRIVVLHDPVVAHRIAADRDLVGHDVNYGKNQKK